MTNLLEDADLQNVFQECFTSICQQSADKSGFGQWRSVCSAAMGGRSSYYYPALCLWQRSGVSQRPAVEARGPLRTAGSLRGASSRWRGNETSKWTAALLDGEVLRQRTGPISQGGVLYGTIGPKQEEVVLRRRASLWPPNTPVHTLLPITSSTIRLLLSDGS